MSSVSVEYHPNGASRFSYQEILSTWPDAVVPDTPEIAEKTSSASERTEDAQKTITSVGVPSCGDGNKRIKLFTPLELSICSCARKDDRQLRASTALTASDLSSMAT